MAVKLDVFLNIISKSAIQKMGRELDTAFKSYGKNFNLDDFFGGSQGFSALEKNFAKAEKSMDRITRATERLTLRWMRSGVLERMAEMFGYDIYGEEGMNELARFKEDFANKWFFRREKEKAENRSKSAKYASKMKQEQEREQEYWRKFYHPSESEQEGLDEDYKWAKEQKQQQELNKNTKGINALLKNILKGRWAAALTTTIAGAAIYGAYRLIKKGVQVGYQTSMTGLDWQRTISGGASSGAWFGKDIASYQRAGMGAANIQNFKRNIQSYLGSVKLGMGNAAPLMYLGLSALGNPDELEKEMERALRRLPKDVSLAMAGQMGLDYNMWEAIYSGRLDRTKSFYSQESMQKWSQLADSMNDLITNLKTFFFNKLAPVAELAARFLDKIINKGSSLETLGNMARMVNPFNQLAYLIKFGAVEVTVKDTNGNTLGKSTSEVLTDGFIEVPQ